MTPEDVGNPAAVDDVFITEDGRAAEGNHHGSTELLDHSKAAVEIHERLPVEILSLSDRYLGPSIPTNAVFVKFQSGR